MELSIIIVSWNVADLLLTCLRSIYATADPARIEVIVVDSASTDDAVSRVRENYPQVQLIPQSENVGFTRGSNIGLREARGKYLFLLNPDTEIVGSALEDMIAYLNAHAEIGIIGPRTLNTDRTQQSTRRRFPTLATAIFESTWLQGYAPRSVLDRYYVADAADDATAEVDWVQGSALLARRAVYEQIGGLDEGYVMFSEEMDWCKRAKDAGWRVVYLGTVQIIHHGGKSTDQVVARRHIHFQESKLRYFRKYHGVIVAQGLRLFLLTSYVLQMVLEAAKGMVGSKRRLRQERVSQYWRVLRSGLKVT